MAGALLFERARGGAERDVASKSTPTDLVSEADLASERAIRELLRERRPDDGFLGEEEARVEPARAGCTGSSTRSTEPSTSCSEYRSGASASPCATAPGRSPAPCSTPTATSCSAPAGAPRDADLRARRARARPLPARTSRTSGAPARRGARRRGLATAMVATGLAYDATCAHAQARVLERLVPRVRDIRRFGSAALDLAWTAAGRLRRLLRAHGQAVGHRRRRARSANAPACACSSCPCTRTCRGGSSPRRRRSPSRCSSSSADRRSAAGE